jgi:hypothetical protein
MAKLRPIHAFDNHRSMAEGAAFSAQLGAGWIAQ